MVVYRCKIKTYFKVHSLTGNPHFFSWLLYILNNSYGVIRLFLKFFEPIDADKILEETQKLLYQLEKILYRVRNVTSIIYGILSTRHLWEFSTWHFWRIVVDMLHFWRRPCLIIINFNSLSFFPPIYSNDENIIMNDNFEKLIVFVQFIHEKSCF